MAEAAQWLARHGSNVSLPAPAGTAAATGEPRDEIEPAAEAESDAADPHAVARTIVLRKLAARAHTRHELEQALRARKVPTAVAEQVLDRMTGVGLVDDTAFAAAWVESRQQRRHLSTPALRRELQVKGVDRDTIEAVGAQVDTEDEVRAARALVERKSAAMGGLDHQVRYRRLAGLLTRRGFGPAVIAQLLAELPGECP